MIATSVGNAMVSVSHAPKGQQIPHIATSSGPVCWVIVEETGARSERQSEESGCGD